MIARSPTSTCPARVPLLEKTTSSPTTQSCAMWVYARKLPRLPTRVVPPGAVARCTVTNSRKAVVLADLQAGRLAGVLQILRTSARRRRTVKNSLPRADLAPDRGC